LAENNEIEAIYLLLIIRKLIAMSILGMKNGVFIFARAKVYPVD
jgi:hypothetical protein